MKKFIITLIVVIGLLSMKITIYAKDKSKCYAIICVDMDEFNYYNDLFYSYYLENSPATAGTCWMAAPLIHPTSGEIAVIVKDKKIGDAMDETDKLKVDKLDKDWFPDPIN